MPTFETNLLRKKEKYGYGFAIFTFNGNEELLSRHKSLVSYKILEGVINIHTQEESFILKRGDRISFKPYTYYRKEGSAKIIARDFPPFDPNSVETK